MWSYLLPPAVAVQSDRGPWNTGTENQRWTWQPQPPWSSESNTGLSFTPSNPTGSDSFWGLESPVYSLACDFFQAGQFCDHITSNLKGKAHKWEKTITVSHNRTARMGITEHVRKSLWVTSLSPMYFSLMWQEKLWFQREMMCLKHCWIIQERTTIHSNVWNSC